MLFHALTFHAFAFAFAFLTTDSNKLGQRLLEKMGWVQGKGLGTKEDGATDPLLLPVRPDNEGLGWRERNVNQALRTSYEEALAKLQRHHAPVSSSSAAEARVDARESKEVQTQSDQAARRQIKVRHRFSKLLRAKDASSYTAQDLAVILADNNASARARQQPLPTPRQQQQQEQRDSPAEGGQRRKEKRKGDMTSDRSGHDDESQDSRVKGKEGTGKKRKKQRRRE